MRIRSLWILLVLLGISTKSISQEVTKYDKAMIALANDVAQRVKEGKKLKVAVWYFHDTFGKRTELGNYIGRDFSIHFTNASDGFEVIDRDHLEQILQEHNLNDSGFINPETAKQLGQVIAADAIITGTVDVGLHHLRVRIKVINTESGAHISAALASIPIDENIKYILHGTGINETKNIDERKRRLDRSETYEDPSATSSDCEQQNTGNYCFRNSSKKSYQLDIKYIPTGPNPNNINSAYRGKRYTSILEAGKDACFTDLPTGNYTYTMYDSKIRGQTRLSWDETRGTFRVEKCKSLSYKIDGPGMGSIYSEEKNPEEKKKISLKQILDVVGPLIVKKKQ